MKFLAFTLLLTLASPGYTTSAPAAPAQVMLFGVFHFANPGLDKVKTDQINVMTPENQTYLSGLSNRLSGLEPTHVLVECNPEEQDSYQTMYGAYRAGEHTLSSNENQQLGFRVAAGAGLKEVICYNEADVSWNAKPLFALLEQEQQARGAEFQAEITRITRETQERHQTLSLADLLRLTNDPEQDRLNQNIYLMTNDVGAGSGFEGADAAASWWHRNFRMYANIQAVAQPGTRVIVIGGQGHTAILKTLLATDMRREAVEVTPLL